MFGWLKSEEQKYAEFWKAACSSKENRRLLAQEELIIEVTEALARALEREGISKAELATRLGRSKAFVTQVLGGRNLTLRTIADIGQALRCRIRVEACPEGAAREVQCWSSYTGDEE